MAENSKIEWCDHTFNPWVGCQKISPACDHCYAEGWAKRTGQGELWNGARRRTSAANWRAPRKWNAAAANAGRRMRVFCASLADVFDNQAEPEWRADLWQLIRETPNLDWLLLTKRPQNIAKMLPPDWGDGWPNVWLGTTVEDQEEANRRIPALLDVPAPVRFLSCEPMLGPINLRYIEFIGPSTGFTFIYDALSRAEIHGGIDWVIAGGESGPGARPMHPLWASQLRDQCAGAGVPFLFKQWGEWKPLSTYAGGFWPVNEGGCRRLTPWGDYAPEGLPIQRVGKKSAGRELDGRIHDGFPLSAEIEQIPALEGSPS